MRLERIAASVGLVLVAAVSAQEGERRFGLAEPPARVEGSIRLATYNIENLFDDKDDPALSGPFEDIDDAKPPEHIAAAAEAIRRLDADILALEEIESREVLEWFRDTYLSDMGYRYLVSHDSGDPRGIENALLSRFPVRDDAVWISLPLEGVHPEKLGAGSHPDAGKPLVLKRSPLRATVAVEGGYELTLFIIHHKSGRDFGYQRAAEARKVVELAGAWERDHPGANIAILGDLNSTPGLDAHKVYLEAGYIELIPGERTKETTTHASGRSIDHILANAALKPEIARPVFVLGTIDRPTGSDWRTTPAPKGYASDHYPVAVDIHPRE